MAESKPVSVAIMGKDYLVMCDEQERAILDEATGLLNEKMQQAKNSGNLIGSEKIAVLAALNIAHEMLLYRKQKERYSSEVDNVLGRIQQKIDNACSLVEDRLGRVDCEQMDNI